MADKQNISFNEFAEFEQWLIDAGDIFSMLGISTRDSDTFMFSHKGDDYCLEDKSGNWLDRFSAFHVSGNRYDVGGYIAAVKAEREKRLRELNNQRLEQAKFDEQVKQTRIYWGGLIISGISVLVSAIALIVSIASLHSKK